MKHFLFLLFLLGFKQISAQFECSEKYREAIVIEKPYVILRQLPDTNSKTIVRIPYWSKIQVCTNYLKQEVINGLSGAWYKSSYKDNVGYLFSNSFEIGSASDTVEFRIVLENARLSNINYDPKMNWYGIYKTIYHNTDSLVKVNVELKKVVLNGKTMTVATTNRSNNSKARYLIGTKLELKEKQINNKTYQFSLYGYSTLYPGFAFMGIQVLGNVKEIPNGTAKVQDYKIIIYDSDVINSFKKKDAIYLASIGFLGDIDDDKVDDYVIIEQTSFYEQNIHLYLTNKSGKYFFRKVADCEVWGE